MAPPDDRDTPAKPAPAGLPERFGRYEIEALVGQGGMGRVYRAHDTRLRRRVALKVLREDRVGAPAAEILREARAAAALRHPHIVTVYDVGEVDGTPFLAMEWLDGAPLRSFVGDARVPLPERLRWLGEVAAALAAAHAAGLVHRDVKPDNVLVGVDRAARVLDFGLARSPGDETGATTREDDAPEGHGRIAGTPRYMAPEQLAGAPLAPAADQYAWGVVAYELCAGIHPAAAAGAASIADFARRGAPPPLRDLCPEVPPAVDALVLRALEKRPAARHPDMGTIARALAPWARAGEGAAPLAGGEAAPTGGGEDTVRDGAPGGGALTGEGTVSTAHGLARSARVAPPAAGRGQRRRVVGLAGGAAVLLALGSAVTFVALRAGPPRAAPMAASAPPMVTAAPTSAPTASATVPSAASAAPQLPAAPPSSRARSPVPTAATATPQVSASSAPALSRPHRGPLETEL